MALDIEFEFILTAKPERVMQLLTDTGLIRSWSGGVAVLENKEGGRVEMFDGWVTGNIVKTGARELAYTWKTTEWPEGATASEVHYLLADDEAGTKVILKHSNLPDEEERKSHESGWTDYFFDPMEDYIAVTEKDW